MSAPPSGLAIPRRPAAALGWGRLPVVVRYLVVLAVLCAAWHLYAVHRGPLLMATPWQTAKEFGRGWANGSLLHPTWTTLRLLLEGIGIGLAIGLVLTIFATLTQVGTDLLNLLTSVLNPLPGVAVLPLAMLLFGLNERAILFVIANAAIWPIAITTSTGFKTANQTIVAVGRNIGLSRLRIITDVLVPAALPSLMAGLRTAWAFGWRTVIAAELVFGVAGSKAGLGTYINNAKLYLLLPRMFAGLVTIAVLGVVFEAIFGALERRTVVRWGMKSS